MISELEESRGRQTKEDYTMEDDALSFYSIYNVENWSPFNDFPSDIPIALLTEGEAI